MKKMFFRKASKIIRVRTSFTHKKYTEKKVFEKLPYF